MSIVSDLLYLTYPMLYITLSDKAQDVQQKLCSSSLPLVKKTKTMLKVEFLSPADTVIVEGIEDDCCSEEFLEMYFQNKTKSGAGGNVSVAVTGRGWAAITFEDLNGKHNE